MLFAFFDYSLFIREGKAHVFSVTEKFFCHPLSTDLSYSSNYASVDVSDGPQKHD